MKTKILLIIAGVVALGAFPVQATIWTEGHYEIVDTNVYGEIYIYNDVTVDMFDGDVYKLETFDITTFDMLDGELTDLRVHDNSISNLYGGNLNRLGITENGSLDLYAYDVIHHPTGGYYDRGWVEGNFLAKDLYFSFDFVEPDTFSHINVVPEPATLLLLSLGVLLIRKKT